MLVPVALVLLLAFLAGAQSQNQDLEAAISEMQRANYFTFITLLRMISSSDERFRGNMTFLMPNDRTLSKMTKQQQDHNVADLLLRHSIPSPMLFDYLQHIPSGSVIPSLKRDYMLNISNNGRRNFFINNAKLISPNICTTGLLFRCHGINAVLTFTQNANASPLPSPSPSLSPSPPLIIAPPTLLPPPNSGLPALSAPRFYTSALVSFWISSLYILL